VWLVANGLGGYASGTIAGLATRRYHGLLVAALPNPRGRTMMFDHLVEHLLMPDGSAVRLGGQEHDGKPHDGGALATIRTASAACTRRSRAH
jgi:hypothetical protein